MQQESVEIDGHNFVLTAMAFKDSRKVMNRLMKFVGMYDNPDVNEVGLGLFRFAGLTGLLTDEDLDFFCERYGKCTQVVKPGTSETVPFTETVQAGLFMGKLRLMYAWLDACTEFHFGADLKEYAAAERKMAEKVRAKKSQTPGGQS